MISAKRRGFAMLAVFAIMVSACGGATPSGSPASVAPGGSAASVAPSGGATGDFTFVVDSEPTTLAGSPDDLPTSWITGFIYSTLYQPDYKLVYQPLAADGQPETSADGLTWTVKIKDGIKFHDGTTMTADDVKFTFDLLASPNCRVNPDACSSIADNVASTEVVDPLTVKFTLKQKYAPFISSGLGTTLLLPKTAVEASFARFEEAAGRVNQADVTALVKKVEDATSAENPACVVAEGATAPESCLFATYTAEIEAMLTSAGIELANKAGYNTGGETGDRVRSRGLRAGHLRPAAGPRQGPRRVVDRRDRPGPEDHRLRQEPDRFGPAEVRQVQRRPERRARTLRRLLRWHDRCRSPEDPGQGVRGRHPQLGCGHRGSRQ